MRGRKWSERDRNASVSKKLENVNKRPEVIASGQLVKVVNYRPKVTSESLKEVNNILHVISKMIQLMSYIHLIGT